MDGLTLQTLGHERRLDVIEFCAVARALNIELVALLDQLVESTDPDGALKYR